MLSCTRWLHTWASCLINVWAFCHTPWIFNFINSLMSWVCSFTESYLSDTDNIVPLKIPLWLIWPTCSAIFYFHLFNNNVCWLSEITCNVEHSPLNDSVLLTFNMLASYLCHTFILWCLRMVAANLSADSQPKSVGLVWGLAATRRSVCIHQMNRVNSRNDYVMMTAP